MFKKLNRMWMRSLEKAGRAQLKRVTKALKPKPVPLTKPAKSTKPAKPTKPAKLAKVSKAAQAAPGSWTTALHVGRAGRSMRYRLFLPAQPARAGAMPMIVMLHGCQQDAAVFAAGTRMNQLAADKGYAVLYPEQSVSAHPHRCWKWYASATQRGGGDVATIAQLIGQVVDAHVIDRSRIYACGISAGAAMAQLLALNHPELIAAVGLHSGPVFGTAHNAMGAYGVMQHGSVNPLAPIHALLARHPDFPAMPAILVTGDDDEVVRPVNQLQLVRQFTALNHASVLVAAPVQITPFGRVSKAWPRKRAMQQRDYLAEGRPWLRSVHIQGLGHAWSGGDEAYAFNAKGPDAGKLMLAFFRLHRRMASG